MNAWSRIMAVSRIEMLRILRLRIAFTLLFLVPALQVALFGYAIRPTAATIGIAIAAPSAGANRLIENALAGQTGLHIIASGLAPGSAEAMVRKGEALIGLEAPNAATGARQLRVIVDATNAALSAPAVAQIQAAYWRAAAGRSNAAGRAPPPQIERLFNPEGRADWSFLPALIGVTTMISMVMLGTLSLAREREAGTWETMLMLPVRPIEALVGKLLPYMIIGTAQGLLVLAAGRILFDLPMQGSVVALVAMIPLFVAAHLALGQAIASRAATQLEALQGAVAFYLPAMLLSGFLYPFEAMPRWAQMLGSLFPLTHFVRAAQDILLRGADAAALAGPVLAIFIFFVLAQAIAIVAYARRID